ncbi:hypothetical protein [Methylobacterium sp. E-046]|uniref:hypothetical protein n=1 Tax=Methylobacterium sp. E-046 TaxID=2836576 RepID=UPI001FB99AE6|nr:hypothetical protein [Methylobacterium sp. E-046]MCJ2102806.1 hypothetical protein [Methylobacterium sp. E-046]
MGNEHVDLHDAIVDRRDEIGMGCVELRVSGRLAATQIGEHRRHLIPLLSHIREDHLSPCRLQARRLAASKQLHCSDIDPI